jgi:hypothetical protein
MEGLGLSRRFNRCLLAPHGAVLSCPIGTRSDTGRSCGGYSYAPLPIN